MLLTFVLVVFGWIIFRAENMGQAWDYFLRMANGTLFSVPLLITRSFYIPLMIGILVMLVIEWIYREKPSVLSFSESCPHWLKFSAYYVLMLSLFWFGGKAESFIYFQF